jgi:hypothetical protein
MPTGLRRFRRKPLQRPPGGLQLLRLFSTPPKLSPEVTDYSIRRQVTGRAEFWLPYPLASFMRVRIYCKKETAAAHTGAGSWSLTPSIPLIARLYERFNSKQQKTDTG